MTSNTNPTEPLSHECSVCYDDKPSGDFDLSGNYLETLCECYKRDSEKLLCLECCRRLRIGENRCPFCRRFNFLRNTRISSLVPSCFDYEHRYTHISNADYNALSQEQKDEYRRVYMASCYEFNARLYEHITQTPENEMPNAHRLYMYIFREAIQHISENDDTLNGEANNWFITNDDNNFLTAGLANFSPATSDLLNEPLYIYIRDENTEDGYRRYVFTTYSPEDVISYAEEYIDNNIRYMSPSFIHHFIPEGTTRLAMRPNNTTLWEHIQSDECFNDLLTSLIDIPEMVDCIISGASPSDIELYTLFGIDDTSYINSGYLHIESEEYTMMLYEY